MATTMKMITAHKVKPKPRLPPDPFTAFRFLVAFDQDDEKVIGGFSDVSGLVAETEIETFREGGVNTTEQQLVGFTKFSSRLVLKRGMADKNHLWLWYLGVMQGAIWRRDVRIKVLSNDGQQNLRWTFRQACPVKWTGPELHAATSAVAFESIELTHKGLLPLPAV